MPRSRSLRIPRSSLNSALFPRTCTLKVAENEDNAECLHNMPQEKGLSRLFSVLSDANRYRSNATWQVAAHAPIVTGQGRNACTIQPHVLRRLYLYATADESGRYRMYSRKRKRYTNSLSPRESAEPQHSQDDTNPTQNYPVQTRATQRPKTNDVIETYRGRDRYLGRHVSFDEAIASPNHQDSESGSGSGSRLSPADLELLTHQGAFQLPPKSVQDEYIAAYMKYCNVWTPIVEPEWLHGQSVSYLLLQSILLAASRVSKQPSTHGTSADFYRRAKLLFFFGHERNPLISIVSAVLLHWYNPVGPETISTDTSGFWLRTAEAIAFQIGLHKEPPGSGMNESKRKRALRRRLWWTLVVSSRH